MDTNFVIVKTGQREYKKLLTKDIAYIQAARSYCTIFDAEGKEVATLSKP